MKKYEDQQSQLLAKKQAIEANVIRQIESRSVFAKWLDSNHTQANQIRTNALRGVEAELQQLWASKPDAEAVAKHPLCPPDPIYLPEDIKDVKCPDNVLDGVSLEGANLVQLKCYNPKQLLAVQALLG